MNVDRECWRGQLSRRILAQLAHSGISHAQLATSAGVSVAAVGDALNPVKSPPSADDLDLLAGVLGITGSALIQLHVLRDRADTSHRQAPLQLSGYLQAARQAARERPFPGAVPGSIPSLSDIYVSQSAYLDNDDWVDGPLFHTGRQVAAEAILRQERNCCIVGGQGSGKSTLLRIGLAAMADRWLGGHTDPAIPVMVPAVSLAGEDIALPEALAATVNADLSDTGQPDLVPPDVFQLEPQPGVSWLLLIDGLDDIADRTARLRVQNTIIANARDIASPYRFIVAVRSPASLGIGWNWSTYWLQPFTPEDLQEVAKRWFAAVGSHAPEHLARSFASALERARLTDLARTPLVATMLCQLYAAEPDRQLPEGRSPIYQQFAELLHDRQHQRGIRAETHIALQRHGQHAVMRAQDTFDALWPLLASLAIRRHTGNTENVLDLLFRQPDASCPEQVPQRLWQQFLGEILESSGLMTRQSGDLAFLHQTFADDLAARHIVEDRKYSTQESSKLFGSRHAKNDIWPDLGWMDRPAIDDSFTGFLLDAWRNTAADPSKALSRIAARNLFGCRFIMAQARLGTQIPPAVVAAAADRLARCAADASESGFVRRQAIETLIAIGDARSRNLLTSIVDNLAPTYQLQAMRILAYLGASHAFDALAAIANSASWEGGRLEAMRSLAGLGDTRGQELMKTMATDSAVCAETRRQAAQELTELGDPSGREVLAAMAFDTGLSGHQRRRAADSLVSLGDHRGRDALAAMAFDTDCSGHQRCQAASSLITLNDPRGRDALALIADDSDLNGFRRRQAAKTLAESGDPRGAALLAGMTVDPGFDPSWRRRAAETLATFGDRRGTDALAAIAIDANLDESWRRRAAEALTGFEDHEDPEDA